MARSPLAPRIRTSFGALRRFRPVVTGQPAPQPQPSRPGPVRGRPDPCEQTKDGREIVLRALSCGRTNPPVAEANTCSCPASPDRTQTTQTRGNQKASRRLWIIWVGPRLFVSLEWDLRGKQEKCLSLRIIGCPDPIHERHFSSETSFDGFAWQSFPPPQRFRPRELRRPVHDQLRWRRSVAPVP